MRKAISLMALSAILVVALVGCAAKSSEQGSSQSQASYDGESADSILRFMSSAGEDSAGLVSERADETLSLLDEAYNADEVETFYETCIKEANSFNSAMKDAAIDYCRSTAGDDNFEDAFQKCYDAWNQSGEAFYETCSDKYNEVAAKVQECVSATNDAAAYQEASETYKRNLEKMQEAYKGAGEDYSYISKIAAAIYEGDADVDAVIASIEASN